MSTLTGPTTNGAVLTAHEATIQTAQVEIQVLKVGKKQVTMGLFRQLPFKTLAVFPTGQFGGEPWGHVEYWWDGDGRQRYDSGTYIAGSRLHLVWQAQGRLFRDIVYENPKEGYLWHYAQRLAEAAEAYWFARHPEASRSHDVCRQKPWLAPRTLYDDYRHFVDATMGAGTDSVNIRYTAWREAFQEQDAYVKAWARQWAALDYAAWNEHDNLTYLETELAAMDRFEHYVWLAKDMALLITIAQERHMHRANLDLFT